MFVSLPHSDLFISSANIHRFYKHQANRQGIAVLGFNVNDVKLIQKRYEAKHPNLIHSFHSYEDAQVLEVFAYYDHGENSNNEQQNADAGTLLRFIESKDSNAETPCRLPGIGRVDATFDESSQAAYCDHWVSNVVSRTEFLSTLEDTLGFTPKVDFNAGVVAAGEAQIESTVTGNDSLFRGADKAAVLQDQSQVYLPINNALSEVGYVRTMAKSWLMIHLTFHLAFAAMCMDSWKRLVKESSTSHPELVTWWNSSRDATIYAK